MAERLAASEELCALRQRECDRLTAELHSLEARLTEKSTLLATSQLAADEAISARAHDQLEIARLKRELELQNKHHEKEAHEAEILAAEFNEFRRSTSTARLGLLTELERAKQDKEASESALLLAQQQASRYKSQVEEFERLLHDARQASVQIRSDFESQLSQQQRVIDTLKQSVSALESDKIALLAKIDVLKAEHGRFEEEKRKLAEEAHLAVEEVRKEAKEAETRYLNKLREVEAKYAPDSQILSAMMGISPSLVEEELRSKNLTASKLYAMFASERQARQAAEAEVAKLSEYLDQIMQEIRAKAPALEKARSEHAAALSALDLLADKLQVAMQANLELKAATSSLERQRDDLEQELALAQQEAKDLASQVQNLLRESAGGSTSTTTPPRALESSPGTAADVISTNLVPFRNVAELQERNQQLLRVVRRLSALEAEVNARPDEAALAKAMDEIRELNEGRRRQEEMVLAIVKQRDMYRAMAQQQQVPALLAGESTTTTTTKDNDLARLGDEFKRMSTEHQAQIERLHNELTTARTGKVQAETAKEFLQARVDHLTELNTSMQQETSKLREAMFASQAQLMSMQTLLSTRAQDLTDALNSKRRLESQVLEHASERKLLLSEADQARAQAASLEDQRNAQRTLVDRIEATHTARNNELVARLQAVEQERDAAVRDLQNAQRSITDALGQVSMVTSQAGSERASLQQRVDELAGMVARLEAQLAKELKDKEVLERADKQMREQLRVQRGGGGEQQHALLVQQLTEQLASASKDAETYKAIAGANEEAAKGYEKMLSELRGQLQAVEQTMKEERSANKAEIESMARRLDAAAASKQIEGKLRARVSELEEAVKQAEWKLAGAGEDLKRFALAAKTAETNYARELQMHATNAAALAALRGQYEQVERQVKDAETSVRIAGDKEQQARASKAQIEEALKARQAEVDDLRMENKVLARQLEQQPSAGGGEGGQTAAELQILWSRQRDRLVLEKEEALLAVTSLRQQVETLKRDLDRARLEVKQSEHNKPSTQMTEAELQRLMAAVQENSVLRNLNATFSQEQQRLRDAVQTAKERFARANKDLDEAKKDQAKAKADMLAAMTEAAARAKETKMLQTRMDDMVKRLGGAETVSKEELERASSRIASLEAELIAEKNNANEAKEALVKLEQELSKSRDMEKRLRELGVKQKAQLDEAKAVVGRTEAELVKVKEELGKLKEEKDKREALLARYRAQLVKNKEEAVVAGGNTASAVTAATPATTTTTTEESEGVPPPAPPPPVVVAPASAPPVVVAPAAPPVVVTPAPTQPAAPPVAKPRGPSAERAATAATSTPPAKPGTAEYDAARRKLLQEKIEAVRKKGAADKQGKGQQQSPSAQQAEAAAPTTASAMEQRAARFGKRPPPAAAAAAGEDSSKKQKKAATTTTAEDQPPQQAEEEKKED